MRLLCVWVVGGGRGGGGCAHGLVWVAGGLAGGRVGGQLSSRRVGSPRAFYAARLPRRALGLKAGSGLFWSAEMTKLAQSHANRHAAGAPFAEPTLMAAALGVVWMGRRSSISPHDHARMRGIA